MKQRQTNIELLRNLCMLMVVVVHIMTKSDILWSLPADGFAYWLYWSVYALCMTSVNCYIIISGYFLIDGKWKVSKVLHLYAQVLFYSLFFACIARFVLNIELTSSWLAAVLPITRREYWFATVYIVLYLLSPYLNKFILAMDQEGLKRFLLLNTVLFSVIPTLLYASDWAEDGGAYGVVWFVFLYTMGAYLKRYGINLEKRKSWLGFWGTILCIPLSKFVILFLGNFQSILSAQKVFRASEMLYSLNNIFALGASLFLVLAFMEIRPPEGVPGKAVNWFAKMTFGIYLFHNNRNMSHYFWEKLRVEELVLEGHVLWVFLCTAGVFIVGAIIERIRQRVFTVIGLNRGIEKVGERIQRYFELQSRER